MERLQNSARLIGIETPEICRSEELFLGMVRELYEVNVPKDETVFARATIHVDELVPGTRSRGLHTTLSVFLYEAASIVPQSWARLKTSPWRRNPDFSIPSRAKVNGGYVNSVLAKQDAIDSGYDDAIFLDLEGHVCELSAANIFLVRGGKLITPGVDSDILEGINRRTVIEIAEDEGIIVEERTVDMTELYIAEEVFISGTSAYIAPVIEIDGRQIEQKEENSVTAIIRDRMKMIQSGQDQLSERYMMKIL
jgi:branched-chain amino acid aminotransferase